MLSVSSSNAARLLGAVVRGTCGPHVASSERVRIHCTGTACVLITPLTRSAARVEEALPSWCVVAPWCFTCGVEA